MEITKIWFDSQFIFGVNETGQKFKQSLLWYPDLKTATESERNDYKFGLRGIHWRNLDVDISFESFYNDVAETIPLDISRNSFTD